MKMKKKIMKKKKKEKIMKKKKKKEKIMKKKKKKNEKKENVMKNIERVYMLHLSSINTMQFRAGVANSGPPPYSPSHRSNDSMRLPKRSMRQTFRHTVAVATATSSWPTSSSVSRPRRPHDAGIAMNFASASE